ncbi:hypothetical protein MVES_000454 [Malassezia vespertilionis]|uniref:Rit1 N-terminal domain-containing protein n=1 Tax=Malassezia vespertilionis TaxID=2020962 RepID=A0A2N1JG29_9BASI|nr:hypothetical protein MVES_000454 [Malassezia vespertilionis]
MQPMLSAEREVLKTLRRENKDLWNRVWSIHYDACFVNAVCDTYFPLPLVANMRCGAWYTSPERVQSTSYFKSTDGHMHQWNFSLKRANLHLVPVIQDAPHSDLTGMLVVDSTRRGKRYPDALSKTVPIWCAVLTKASFLRYGTPHCTALQLPPGTVSASERQQIEARLDEWVSNFLTSDLPIPRLTKPLCPFHVHPGHCPAFPTPSEAVHHVVLVSASALENVPHRSEEHASYVQGAGDDHESWAMGLTPELFWKNKTTILGPAMKRPALAAYIEQIVAERALLVLDDDGAYELSTTGLCIARRLPSSEAEKTQYALMVHCTPLPQASSKQILYCKEETGKRGLYDFSAYLGPAVDAVTDALIASDKPVLLASADYHSSAALAIAVLAASFDEHRNLIRARRSLTLHRAHISKDTTQRRLHV